MPGGSLQWKSCRTAGTTVVSTAGVSAPWTGKRTTVRRTAQRVSHGDHLGEGYAVPGVWRPAFGWTRDAAGDQMDAAFIGGSGSGPRIDEKRSAYLGTWRGRMKHHFGDVGLGRVQRHLWRWTADCRCGMPRTDYGRLRALMCLGCHPTNTRRFGAARTCRSARFRPGVGGRLVLRYRPHCVA